MIEAEWALDVVSRHKEQLSGTPAENTPWRTAVRGPACGRQPLQAG
jgi:hypothetical protein